MLRQLPVAVLTAGLSVSFVVIGLFVATGGFAIGLKAGVLRYVAATLRMAVGSPLALARPVAPLATANSP